MMEGSPGNLDARRRVRPRRRESAIAMLAGGRLRMMRACGRRLVGGGGKEANRRNKFDHTCLLGAYLGTGKSQHVSCNLV
jgi:hypothetical protein